MAARPAWKAAAGRKEAPVGKPCTQQEGERMDGWGVQGRIEPKEGTNGRLEQQQTSQRTLSAQTEAQRSTVTRSQQQHAVTLRLAPMRSATTT